MNEVVAAGRIVHFSPAEGDEILRGDGPLAGIVSSVTFGNEVRVKVCVFDVNGKPCPRQSVLFLDEFDAPLPEGGTAI